MNKSILKYFLLISIIAFSGDAFSIVVQYSDFSSTAGLSLNGSAASATTSDGEVLRITPAIGNQSGSFFSSSTINVSDFSTFFKFRITEPGGSLFDGNTQVGADGIVFVVQSVSSDIGGMGQGIGYSGITPSVGVEFDTWHNSYNNDPDSNHVGIDINGNVDHGTTNPCTLSVSPDFDNGNLWYSWIDYNGSTLELRFNQTGIRPLNALLSKDLDIESILGVTDAYIGFTSGTGADWGNHDIIQWQFRDSYNPINTVPEPTSIIMFLLSILGFLKIHKRNR